MTNKGAYVVCQERGHKKSNRTISDSEGNWDICHYCLTWFRWVTTLKEKNAPDE